MSRIHRIQIKYSPVDLGHEATVVMFPLYKRESFDFFCLFVIMLTVYNAFVVSCISYPVSEVSRACIVYVAVRKFIHSH